MKSYKELRTELERQVIKLKAFGKEPAAVIIDATDWQVVLDQAPPNEIQRGVKMPKLWLGLAVCIKHTITDLKVID